MKNIFTILLLLIITLKTFPQVKQDSIRTYELGEVVISSSNSAIIKSSSALDIGLEKILSVGGTDISKVFNQVSGVIPAQTSKNESKIYMRGFDQTDIAVFIDGVPIYQPFDGLVDLSNLPINAFSKITVSKGMSSLLYGSNSMGGSINLITKESFGTFSGNAVLESGFSNKISAGVSGSLGSLYYSFNGTYSKSNGFDLPKSFAGTPNEDAGLRNNSQFENLGGIFKIGINNFYNFDIAYSLLLIDNSKGIPVEIYAPRPRYWKFTDWKKSINNIIVRTSLSDNITIKANAFYEKFYNVLDSYNDATYSAQTMPYAFHSVYDDYSYGFNISAGIDTRIIGITSLYATYRNDVHREQGNFNQPFKKYEASNFSIGAEQDVIAAKNISVVFGLGYDLLNPIYANGGNVRSSIPSLNGNAGISYMPSEKVRLHFNLTSRSRFPLLKELYHETAGRDLANPDLKVERALNTETGVSYNYHEQNKIKLTFFYSDVKNLIKVVLLPVGLNQYQNIGKAEFFGFELETDYMIEQLVLNANYTFLSAENKSDNAVKDILEYRPKHTLSLSANYLFDFGLTIGSEFILHKNEYGINPTTTEFAKMPERLFLNLLASQTIFNNYVLYLRVNNLMDKYSESEFGYPLPGRELLFGLKITM